MQLKEEASPRVVKLPVLVRNFYDILGVPGHGIKPPVIKDHHVFLQNTSQEQKFLEAGSWLLYKD